MRKNTTRLWGKIKKAFSLTTKKVSQKSPTSAEELNKENYGEEGIVKELAERHQIEGTPLWLIGNKEKGYALFLGQNRVSPVKKEKLEVHEWMETNMWDLVVSIVIAVDTELKLQDIIPKEQSTNN